MPVHFHFPSAAPLRDRTRLKSYLHQLCRTEKKDLADLSVVFCSDQYLLGINQQFLQHHDYTDIITFDMSESGQRGITGELYISIDRVRDNARQLKVSLQSELHRVIFHGLLHLCGYSDKSAQAQKRMRQREDVHLSTYFS